MSTKRESTQYVPVGEYFVGGHKEGTNMEVIHHRFSEIIWGDHGNYGYPDFNRPDVGGDFLVSFYEANYGTVDVGHIVGGTVYGTHTYKGKLVASRQNPWIWPITDARSWGPEAYRKMKPDRPEFSALNAIYELKDLPGMLQQRLQKDGLRNVGNYYLALKFGWEPLLRDIRNLVNLQRRGQDKLKQLLRDEGRPVKRRISLFDEFTQSHNESYTTFNGEMNPPFVSFFYANWNTHKVNRIRGSSDKVWASARFRYWLPGGPRDIAWQRRVLATIYGLNPTPEAVYNAIPWSWLIDWFSNLGDCISNMQTTIVDRLAADYFYVMRETKGVVINTCHTEVYPVTGGIKPVTATTKVEQGSKSRLRGDPFGFGTNQNSLNGTQLSILGALGMSKLR